MSNTNIITFDARDAFRAGEHPCDQIQGALNHVTETHALRLVVPFEPVPIFEVARTKGLTYTARQTDAGDWEVLFTRNPAPTADPSVEKHSCGCGCSSAAPTEIVDVDARGLVPPQPMVKILEALASLPEHAAVRARTDRRPIHLYPILIARGFTGNSEEHDDGSFITEIRRA
jgi:uncharacterized protein (DUF2249 family)